MDYRLSPSEEKNKPSNNIVMHSSKMLETEGNVEVRILKATFKTYLAKREEADMLDDELERLISSMVSERDKKVLNRKRKAECLSADSTERKSNKFAKVEKTQPNSKSKTSRIDCNDTREISDGKQFEQVVKKIENETQKRSKGLKQTVKGREGKESREHQRNKETSNKIPKLHHKEPNQDRHRNADSAEKISNKYAKIERAPPNSKSKASHNESIYSERVQSKSVVKKKENETQIHSKWINESEKVRRSNERREHQQNKCSSNEIPKLYHKKPNQDRSRSDDSIKPNSDKQVKVDRTPSNAKPTASHTESNDSSKIVGGKQLEPIAKKAKNDAQPCLWRKQLEKAREDKEKRENKRNKHTPTSKDENEPPGNGFSMRNMKARMPKVAPSDEFNLQEPNSDPTTNAGSIRQRVLNAALPMKKREPSGGNSTEVPIYDPKCNDLSAYSPKATELCQPNHPKQEQHSALKTNGLPSLDVWWPTEDELDGIDDIEEMGDIVIQPNRQHQEKLTHLFEKPRVLSTTPAVKKQEPSREKATEALTHKRNELIPNDSKDEPRRALKTEGLPSLDVWWPTQDELDDIGDIDEKDEIVIQPKGPQRFKEKIINLFEKPPVLSTTPTVKKQKPSREKATKVLTHKRSELFSNDSKQEPARALKSDGLPSLDVWWPTQEELDEIEDNDEMDKIVMQPKRQQHLKEKLTHVFENSRALSSAPSAKKLDLPANDPKLLPGRDLKANNLLSLDVWLPQQDENEKQSKRQQCMKEKITDLFEKPVFGSAPTTKKQEASREKATMIPSYNPKQLISSPAHNLKLLSPRDLKADQLPSLNIWKSEQGTNTCMEMGCTDQHDYSAVAALEWALMEDWDRDNTTVYNDDILQ